MQSAVAVSREQLADDWTEYYMTSPIWRFALAPGVCGGPGAMGLMIPSVDEVGRCYPLTLAHPGEYPVWAAHLRGDAWYEEAEHVLLNALRDGMSFSGFMEGLERLAMPGPEPLPVFRTELGAALEQQGWMVDAQLGRSRTETALGLLDRVYRRLLGGYSLWWTKGSDHVPACLLVTPGLPGAGQYAAMLDGNWHQWGWALEQVMEPGTGERSDA
ncbi:MAG: type VI secretion system-associated protein TagF [Ectothiorhodospiraceae bacterium]|nr:type VI secretion system-associated protein TagF [Ectothiorhodospiraceae bacterium]